MKMKSDFAVLDVTAGRAALARHFKKEGEPIKVVIEGEITNIWGNDDGTSQGFQLDVKRVSILS